jgi:hypothetical protein
LNDTDDDDDDGGRDVDAEIVEEGGVEDDG